MTEKQTSEELKVCPFCRKPPTGTIGSDGRVEITCSDCDLYDVDFGVWQTRTPDLRMVEVLREARQFIQKQNHAVCGNYCESCQLLDRIDALLKGEKPTEPFKEGAD